MSTPAKVTLWRHTDPAPDGPRHGLRSNYVEQFYLPTLGPTAIAMLRWADREIAESGVIAAVTIEVPELAAHLGIDADRARTTLVRLARRNFITDYESESFGFPWDLPSLAPRHVRNLPTSLRGRFELATVFGEQRDLSDTAWERFRELEDEEGR